jgi:hypothetical protein
MLDGWDVNIDFQLQSATSVTMEIILETLVTLAKLSTLATMATSSASAAISSNPLV